jgi:hypothetical protein
VTFREQVVVRILLLVARMLSDDANALEIKHLANHISTWAPKVEEKEVAA